MTSEGEGRTCHAKRSHGRYRWLWRTSPRASDWAPRALWMISPGKQCPWQQWRSLRRVEPLALGQSLSSCAIGCTRQSWHKRGRCLKPQGYCRSPCKGQSSWHRIGRGCVMWLRLEGTGYMCGCPRGAEGEPRRSLGARPWLCAMFRDPCLMARGSLAKASRNGDLTPPAAGGILGAQLKH